MPNFVTQSSSFENYFRFMPRYIHIILLTISASFGHFGAAGATNTDEITVRFRVNSSAVDTTYCSNADALSLLLNKIDSINGNGSIKLEQIVLAGSASPEGPTEYNRRLSDQRLKALREHILLKTGIADSLIRETHRLTDWGLLAEMVEGSDMPQKEEALSLIRKMPEYITEADGREIIELRSKLTGLSDGKAWRRLSDNGKIRFPIGSLHWGGCADDDLFVRFWKGIWRILSRSIRLEEEVIHERYQNKRVQKDSKTEGSHGQDAERAHAGYGTESEREVS